jgi:amidase
MFPEYANYDGLGLAELVRKGDVTPTQLVEEAISRIEQHNPKLNAVIYKMYDHARQAAANALPDGVFKGVPFLLKDLMAAYAGVPITAGCRFLKDYVPPYDSEMVKRYKATGVVILGKTNTPEFGITPFTEPELFGPTHNPWDVQRTPGGSSGGSASAVAARIVPLASGGDGGGSIRIPASCCGLFGMKPTRGRTPTGPDAYELWEGLAIEHVVTRSVRDSAAMLDAISGGDPGAPYVAPPPVRPYLQEVTTEPGKLRIAYTSKPFMGHYVHEDCVKGLNATVKLLQDLGHEVYESTPDVNGEELAYAMLLMIAGQTHADIREIGTLLGRKPTPADFEIGTWALNMLGGTMGAKEYIAAVRTLHYAARKVGQFFETCDVLLTPTLSEPPFIIGALQATPAERNMLNAVATVNAGWLLSALNIAKQVAAKAFDWIPYTPLFNITGQPAMSVPLHWNDAGLPVGMHFIGRFADESTLFRLAGQLERACPWFDRAPQGY